MLVSRGRMLLGFLMLPVGVVVGGLQVMMSGSVMVRRSRAVMLCCRVFGWIRHGLVLLERFGTT
jgi:hypothetical protein